LKGVFLLEVSRPEIVFYPCALQEILSNNFNVDWLVSTYKRKPTLTLIPSTDHLFFAFLFPIPKLKFVKGALDFLFLEAPFLYY
jgi:hypothetical protein